MLHNSFIVGILLFLSSSILSILSYIFFHTQYFILFLLSSFPQYLISHLFSSYWVEVKDYQRQPTQVYYKITLIINSKLNHWILVWGFKNTCRYSSLAYSKNNEQNFSVIHFSLFLYRPVKEYFSLRVLLMSWI